MEEEDADVFYVQNDGVLNIINYLFSLQFISMLSYVYVCMTYCCMLLVNQILVLPCVIH
jgi:hypothetical protein